MRFMVSTPAQSSIKSSPNSEILRQRPSAPKSRTFCTLGFVSDGRFLVLHLKQTVLQQNLYNCVKSTPQFQIAECFFGFNNSVSGAGVPPDFHQADNLAQLWQEFLSLLELIAQILCAVVGARANAVCGNRQTVFVSI